MPDPTATTASPPTATLSRVYLVVMCALIVVTGVLPLSVLVSDLVYSLVGLSVVIAVLVGIKRNRPRAVAGWYCIAAGQWLWVVADAIFDWQAHVSHVETFPSMADVFYLLGYPTFAVGLALLVKDRRQSRRDLGPLLDSATVTAGLCLLSWVALARPTLESMQDSMSAATVAAAYPAMDILLVGALVRLISTPGGRSAAFRYLLAALGMLIVADTISVANDLYASNSFTGVDYLWQFSYAAWGAAALHPSMAKLSERGSSGEIRVRGVRLTAFVLATLISPAILAAHEITGVAIDMWAVIIGSMVMFLLVIVRLNLAVDKIASAHEALETLQDELAVQATHDPLTGLVNRIQSMRLLAGALGRSRRRGTNVGLLFIDLDGFKAVNDNHGHRYGDEVLRQVAARMKEEIRDGDFLGRLGGDEFVVGIEDVEDEQAAARLAQRLIAAVSEEIPVGDDLVVRVGASVGVALGRGGETDVETLLHEADLAVYRAKASGRGCVQMFNRQARADLKHRNDLERALARAIAEDELVLHYQPIVHVETGTIECYEALVRWNRPGVGLMHPDQFLPVAEASDLICELDAWVLRTAAAELARWNEQRGDHALQVAVNISGRHISKPRILDDVASSLRAVDVLPPQLVIEVTETALMDAPVAATNLEALRHMGLVVSLDDFGTGYQSNAQLQRLPVDVLKIDRQYVVASSPSELSLLELMVKTAHAFGARVVAEGVEHPEQLELIRRLGCEYAQGYYLGMPTPAERLHPADEGGLLAG